MLKAPQVWYIELCVESLRCHPKAQMQTRRVGFWQSQGTLPQPSPSPPPCSPRLFFSFPFALSQSQHQVTVWAFQIAQQAKGLATKPEDVIRVSKTHMVKGENRPDCRKLSSDLHTCTYAHTHTCTHLKRKTH